MKKVLVIEDNATNLYLIRFMLKKSGYMVIGAREGIMGVEMAIKEKPDLVIMDIQLPDIDGLEATRRIRASETDNKMPIVALTSYAMVGDREKSLDAGCTDYIEKPINPETFISKIEKYL
jgi:two-component system, cell cycle response regulator DivK